MPREVHNFCLAQGKGDSIKMALGNEAIQLSLGFRTRLQQVVAFDWDGAIIC